MSPERIHRRQRWPKGQMSFLRTPVFDAPDLVRFSTPLSKDLSHPQITGEKPKIELPTHAIGKNTIIVALSSRGPAREKILQKAYARKLKGQKMGNHPAFRLTTNTLTLKIGGDGSLFTLTPETIISCYASKAKKISSKRLKEMEAISKH